LVFACVFGAALLVGTLAEWPLERVCPNRLAGERRLGSSIKRATLQEGRAIGVCLLREQQR
jgi:hypothetical protein